MGGNDTQATVGARVLLGTILAHYSQLPSNPNVHYTTPWRSFEKRSNVYSKK